MRLTPAQCRAARALIGLTQDDLAKRSEVSKRTIVSFEAGERTPNSPNLAAINRALTDAGVELTLDGGVRPKPVEAASRSSRESQAAA